MVALALSGLGVVLACAGCALVLVGGHALSDIRPGATTEAATALSPDRLVLTGAAILAGFLIIWLASGLCLSAVATLPGLLGGWAGRAAARLAPAAVRVVVASAVGAAVVPSASLAGSAPAWGVAAIQPQPVLVHGSATSPAAASTIAGQGVVEATAGSLPDPSWPGRAGVVPVPALPAPGWTPSRPPAPARPSAPIGLVSAAPAPDRHDDPAVTVRRGDSLWTIAARHLGPAATAVEIAAAWPRWYAANRHVIGPDPALIRPGQQLRPP